jgi:hypothetical protein
VGADTAVPSWTAVPGAPVEEPKKERTPRVD